MIDNTREIVSEAQLNAMSRGSYPDTSTADPDVLLRESIRALEPVAPSASVAAALFGICGVHPVPVDRETLELKSGPLETLTEVDTHWRGNMTDGVGVRAGVQSNGETIFALRGTLAALRSWLADVGAEDAEVRNEYGTVVSTSRTYRP